MILKGYLLCKHELTLRIVLNNIYIFFIKVEWLIQLYLKHEIPIKNNR
jgi:hypothetical protein